MGKNYEDLQVWQRSKVLAVAVYRATDGLKDFGFRDQITRSALSIPSNIAEGAERPGRREFSQFVGYAKGSAGELRTQLLIGAELLYIEPMLAAQLAEETFQLSRMLHALIQSLKEGSE